MADHAKVPRLGARVNSPYELHSIGIDVPDCIIRRSCRVQCDTDCRGASAAASRGSLYAASHGGVACRF